MLYQRPSFICPTTSANTTQQQFDLAVLSKEEYMRKYKISAAAYGIACSQAPRAVTRKDI